MSTYMNAYVHHASTCKNLRYVTGGKKGINTHAYEARDSQSGALSIGILSGFRRPSGLQVVGRF